MKTMVARNAKASLMTIALPPKVFERLNLTLTSVGNMKKYQIGQRVFKITAGKKHFVVDMVKRHVILGSGPSLKFLVLMHASLLRQIEATLEQALWMASLKPDLQEHILFSYTTSPRQINMGQFLNGIFATASCEKTPQQAKACQEKGSKVSQVHREKTSFQVQEVSEIKP